MEMGYLPRERHAASAAKDLTVKPLPENHFAIEDWDVIIDVVLRCGRIVDGSMFGYWVMERGKQSDRRDAALMLAWMQLRRMNFVGPSPICWDGIPVSGRVLR